MGFPIKYGDDLKSEHEKALVKEFGNKPLFITHWLRELKFFNMREDPANPNEVICADLEMPYSGEAVGAAEREYRYERLGERLISSQMYKILLE
jgi:asparaginyl-tRNA synthetase